jgi:hypothetical protein
VPPPVPHRYFRRVDEGIHAWGDPVYWLEVNEAGDAERQIVEYPNGNVLSYDRAHEEDDHGALGIMVIDGDEDGWAPWSITAAEFAERWRDHRPINRTRPAPPAQ